MAAFAAPGAVPELRAQDAGGRAALTALAAERFAAADALGAARFTVGQDSPRVLIDSGFGRADGRRVTSRTRFALGHMSELGTLAALLEMVDYGIDLESSVRTALVDQLPSNFGKITLRMLAEHRSGLPDDLTLNNDEADRVDFFLERVGRSGLRATPGHAPRHSNRLDYRVLAAAIAQLAELPFDQVIREEVLPGRLTDPAWVTTEVSARRADELAVVGSRDRVLASGALQEALTWRKRGAADWVASARGLHEWLAQRLRPGTAAAPSLGDRLLAGEGAHALGFTIDRDHDGQVERVQRRATAGPTRAWIEWWPQQHAILVVLGTQSAPVRLVEELAARIPSPDLVSAKQAATHRAAGRYRLDRHNQFAVEIENGIVRFFALGPKAAARVTHGQPTMPEWPNVHRDYAARAALVGRALVRRNRKGLQRHFHTEAAPDAGARAVAMIDATIEEHGALKGPCRVLGYSPSPVARSIVSARFGERDVRFSLVWHGEQIREIALAHGPLPFGVVLVPITDEPGVYRAQSIDQRKGIRVEFLGSPDKPASGLRWFDQGKRGRKGIRCARIQAR